jgi:hypothetical protein
MDGQAHFAPNAVSVGAAAAPATSAATQAPCLVVNPKSFGASRRGLAERAAALVRAQGGEVFQATDATGIAATVEWLLQRRQRTIIILAGDGTVQAIADRLASASTSLQPQLLVLGGGRSNVTAGEFGGRGDVSRTLETALRQCREGTTPGVEVRHVLRIEQPQGPARHGFLLLAGLPDYAIRACHRHRRSSGRLRGSDAATAWSLVKVALPAMLGMREPPLDDLRVEVPGHEPRAKAVRWLLATTLQRPHGIVDPFAQQGEGALRFTAIAASGPAFWARLPWVVTGRFTPAMQAGGYLSGRCESLQVHGLSSYTLDGEEFSADPARPVTIRRGAPLTFLTP